MHMRKVMLVGGLVLLGACNPSGSSSPAGGPSGSSPGASGPSASDRGAEIKATPSSTPTRIAAPLPEGFPNVDPVARATECIVYIGLTQKAGVNPGGHDGSSVDQVVGQWRAALRTDGKMSETEAQQLIGSSVNPLMSTPPAQRDAASAWCFENVPPPK